MKRIFNYKTMSYSYPDGSGVQTVELLIRKNLLIEKVIYDGLEGKRNYEKEKIEVDKWFDDYKKLSLIN